MTKKYEKKRHKNFKRKLILMLAASFFLGVLCGKYVFAEKELPKEEEISKEHSSTEEEKPLFDQEEERQEAETLPWNLLLVNAAHAMEEGYEPELEEIENNYMADKRIVRELQNMLEDGRRKGLDFWICSAYRSMEKQTQLYENKVRRLMEESGLDYEQACEEAGTVVAYPGTSEHQLGLAVDIVAKDYQLLDEKQSETAEAKWLKENCWKYGFILRYPLNKTAETGIIFEPWHYRYVGKEAAREIMSRGICLEEYLEILEKDEKE